MLRDITLGQYYSADSIIHRLDPRVKLFGTLMFLVSLFISNSIIGYFIATFFLLIVIKLSKVPFLFMVKGLKVIVMLLLISVCFNLFLTPGEVLVQFWILKVTKEGIKISAFITVRLIYLIVGSTIMTLTTTPNDLTDGMEKALNPLKKIHIPIHEIAMMMSIALRFIPILMEETDKIMKAQMARGADFENGSLMKRIKGLIPLLIPLFVSTFRRAADLAMAMEARCYRGGIGRTKMKPLKYKSADRLAYVIYLVYIGAIITGNIITKQIDVLSKYMV